MGRHMQFEQYDPASIKKEIEEELKEKYNITEVVYVNPVYDIADYYRVVASQHEILKLKLLADAHMKAYMEENKCDKAAYIEVINNPEECPKDAPKRGGLCSKRSCDPTEIDQELADIKERLDELDAQASKESAEDQEETFTGVVFVVLDKPNECSKVLAEQDAAYCLKFFKNICSCFCLGTKSWTWERAPEPTDIFWENMNVHFCKRVLNSMLSWVLTLCMAAVCFFFI